MPHSLSLEDRYRLLNELSGQPQAAQRDLARALGVSVGKLNYCLRALIEKGLVKGRSFRDSESKPAYLGATVLGTAAPWMVVAGALFATGQVIALLFMLANQSRMLIASKIVTAIACVALNVELYGLRGVIASARTFDRGAAR
jgi:DNA-binding Lrp family transcriptional regulator